jgi:hypothetical protein
MTRANRELWRPAGIYGVQDEYPLWKVLPQFAQLLLDHRDDLDDYQGSYTF